MNQRNLVVLVDDLDTSLGTMDKLEAHQKGLLHRAFSVLVFNSQRELLIHRRAMGKYHSGGLWTNTCCSHPMPEEDTMDAAHRRLEEEMGFDCPIVPVFQFQYEAKLDRGLTEKEYDHVFLGIFDGKPRPNTLEVMDFRYVALEDLKEEMNSDPSQFTEWFKIIIDKLEPYLDTFQMGTPSRALEHGQETSAA